MSAVASVPLKDGLILFARGGGFAWHGEVDADIAGVEAAQTDKKTGLSGIVGAGLDFAVTKRVALRAEWERYFITRDSRDLATIGLRVKF